MAHGSARQSGASGEVGPKKTHIVSLSFDDGFKRSFYEVAAIYESFGLHACLNVVATGHHPGFLPLVNGEPDPMAGSLKGDFDDWNALRHRGHEIGCHSYDHRDLTSLSPAEAQADIERCILAFRKHLPGFEPGDAVYNFAYNRSTPELEATVLRDFLAVRSHGRTPVNPIPTVRQPVRIGCWSYGPGNVDDFFTGVLNEFLSSPGGWFVFNLHGLDDEGWGPISTECLRSTLSWLTLLDHVEVLPTQQVLLRLPKGT